MNRQQRIPVAVLTGFLGSGKTTVLSHLARSGQLDRTLVLVNEFGEVGLDHHLLTPIDDDTLVAIEAGCICCTIRSDLARTLALAPGRYAREGVRWFDRVIIETTGIADPAPILQTLLGEPAVVRQFTIANVLTAVDAINGAATLENHPEAVKQVAVADRILITKTDLSTAESGAALRDRLKELAPSAPVAAVTQGAAAFDWFFSGNPFHTSDKLPDVEQWLATEQTTRAAHHHDAPDRNRHGQVRAISLVFDAPIEAAALDACFEELMALRGADLLRVKGLINVRGMDKPMVIHGVQHVFHPPEVLDRWPSSDERTRIVLITRDLPEGQLRACFRAFGLESTPNTDREPSLRTATGERH